MSDVALSWTEHRSRFQGRVAGFERRVRMGPKVADPGIDLTRNRIKGVTGWEAERERQRQEKIMQEMVANILSTDVDKPPADDISIEGIKLIDIQESVSAYSGVRMNEILSPRRQANIVKVRQIGMLLCKILTKKSYPEVGRKFGNRDHTTVLHAIRKLAEVEKKLWAKLTLENPLQEWVIAAFDAWEEAKLR